VASTSGPSKFPSPAIHLIGTPRVLQLPWFTLWPMVCRYRPGQPSSNSSRAELLRLWSSGGGQRQGHWTPPPKYGVQRTPDHRYSATQATSSALAFWMQTTGTLLLGVQRCSSIRLRTAAHDGRSARGLLYLTAVRRCAPGGFARARFPAEQKVRAELPLNGWLPQ